MSTVGGTPPGGAATPWWPASVTALYGAANSSAQYPVAYLVPSFNVRYVAPDTTNRIFAIVDHSCRPGSRPSSAPRDLRRIHGPVVTRPVAPVEHPGRQGSFPGST